MPGRIRSRLTYANVASSIALFAALGTGGAYAADTIGSSDVINESLLSEDIKDLEVKTSDIKNSAITSLKINNGSVLRDEIGDTAVNSAKIADGEVANADLADGSVGVNKVQDGAITSAKVLDDNQAGGGLGPQDLATNAVAQAEIATDGVAATEIQNDSIDAGEIVDFGLTNQDIGVLFAEVAAAGTLDGSSGSVTVSRIGAAGSGQYEVDFGRNIVACTSVATLGGSGSGTALGEVNVADRAGNTEAVFVDTNTSSGTAADRAFRLVVVC
jgi:hypothetical protein